MPGTTSTKKERRPSVREPDVTVHAQSKRTSAAAPSARRDVSSVRSQSKRTPTTPSSNRSASQTRIGEPSLTGGSYSSLPMPSVATTWKPLAVKSNETRPHETRSSSHRRGTSAPTAKVSEKKPPEKKSRSFSGLKSESKKSADRSTDSKSEMTLWKRFKNQISSKTLKRSVKTDDYEEAKKSSSKGRLPGRNLGRQPRKKNVSAPQRTSVKDIDAESICTAMPLSAKVDPDLLSSPITPRSLALTNVNDADRSATREVRVLHRCTTLTPELNPRNVFESFQGFGELRGEFPEGPIFAEAPLLEMMDDAESRRLSVFSPPDPPALAQKDSTYSSVTADLLQTHSSGSSIVCVTEVRPKASPRKVFSNPLLSASPELQSPTNQELQASISVKDLRIPNMPSRNSQDSMGV